MGYSNLRQWRTFDYGRLDNVVGLILISHIPSVDPIPGSLDHRLVWPLVITFIITSGSASTLFRKLTVVLSPLACVI